MRNELTDQAFWSSYWESKRDIAFNVPSNYTFSPVFQELIKKYVPKDAIELGGFPGYFAIFLKKYLGLRTALLDFFIHKHVQEQVLAVNLLKPGDIEVIEADLFTHVPRKKYDLVLSCGLIEHFLDTKDIIRHHLAYLADQGTLFITLPNFTGVNGWIQQKFDPENYNKHVIECMNPKLLQSICQELGLHVVQCGYYGKFSVWLENPDQKRNGVKALVKAIWFMGKVFSKIFRFESKLLSPYILLIARKR